MRGWIERGGATGILLMAAVLTTGGPAVAQGWKSTDWTVACDAPTRKALTASDCDANDPVSPAAFIEQSLVEASEWLKPLGFKGPSVEDLGSSYRAVLSDTIDSSAVYKGEQLYVKSENHLAVGTDRIETAADVPGMGTAVHELFHGIQFSHTDPDAFYDDDLLWIWEGTADAVMMNWLRRAQGSPAAYSVRRYDDPLHEPRVEIEEGDTRCWDCYATRDFWDWLGGHLASQDRVAYLGDFLDRNDLEEDNGLAALDGFLQQPGAATDPGGLYEVLPEFVRDELTDGRYFDEDGPPQLNLPYRDQAETASVEGSVKPVAAEAYEVTVPIPAGKMAGLVIEIVDDHEDLHLVVNDLRLDDMDELDRGGGERNTFRTALTGGGEAEELFVRVVNVAPDATATESLDYELEFSLTPLEPCSDELMESVVNRSRAGAFYQAGPPRPFRPQVAELEVRGLVQDGGLACSNHLESLTTLGSGLTGEKSAQEMKMDMLARVEEMKAAVNRATGSDIENLDPDDLTPEQARALAGIVGGMGADIMGSGTDDADVVLEVFSPNGFWWNVGTLLPGPGMVEHRGAGGWRTNATAAIAIQLAGTTPEMLREGATYDAVAFAPLDEVSRAELNTVPTMGGFYTRWDGDFHETATGSEAFRGEVDAIGGRLEGTVTVDEITGAEVQGRFSLSGMGTRRTVEYTLRRDPETGEVRGHETREAQRTGGLTLSGSFRAPTTHEGWQRRPHMSYQTVIIGG